MQSSHTSVHQHWLAKSAKGHKSKVNDLGYVFLHNAMRSREISNQTGDILSFLFQVLIWWDILNPPELDRWFESLSNWKLLKTKTKEIHSFLAGNISQSMHQTSQPILLDRNTFDWIYMYIIIDFLLARVAKCKIVSNDSNWEATKNVSSL